MDIFFKYKKSKSKTFSVIDNVVKTQHLLPKRNIGNNTKSWDVDNVAKTRHLLLKRNIVNNTKSWDIDNVAKTQQHARATPIGLGGLK